MATFCTDLSLPRKIEEYVDARDAAVKLLTDAEHLRNQASRAVGQFLPILGMPSGAKPTDGLKSVIHELDRRFWRVTFEKAGFMQYMDRQAKAEFDEELERKAPEYSLDNIRSTLVQAAADAHAMFRRGLVNVFLRLHPHYRTNTSEPFKVGRKVVIEFMFSREWGGGLCVNYAHGAELNDIDRVFKVLDNEKHVPGSLKTALDQHFHDGFTSEVGPYEDDYYQIKGFKNGNMHIVFKRDDLLEMANKLIAQHYEEGALADGRRAA